MIAVLLGWGFSDTQAEKAGRTSRPVTPDLIRGKRSTRALAKGFGPQAGAGAGSTVDGGGAPGQDAWEFEKPAIRGQQRKDAANAKRKGLSGCGKKPQGQIRSGCAAGKISNIWAKKTRPPLARGSRVKRLGD
jgi:hypothetical protein